MSSKPTTDQRWNNAAFREFRLGGSGCGSKGEREIQPPCLGKSWTFGSFAHELRNEITPSRQTIRGVQEYLSSVKAKKVEGRKERGEKKRSKLRGGVERGRNVPDKSIEHKRGSVQSLAEQYETTFPHRLRDAHGMPACRIACLSPLRDAKLQMALHL